MDLMKYFSNLFLLRLQFLGLLEKEWTNDKNLTSADKWEQLKIEINTEKKV